MPGFTRQIILHTLTELMNEKPLSKITVKDIVERCGVNRNTFYYHFRDIPDAVEAMVKEELNDILKDQKAPESVSDCMEILVNAVQKNKKAMIHLYRSIQRDVFADYLDHATERVVEELINRAVGDFEMDQEDRHLISRYYKCVFVGVILDWLRHDMDYDILSDMHKLEYLREEPRESVQKSERLKISIHLWNRNVLEYY